MPDATINPQEIYHRELKSLPGAYVDLKMLPYHDMLVRRDKGSIASMEQQEGRRKRGEPTNAKMTIETLQTWERQYMFQNCIVDHNLEDSKGEKLDFRSQMTFKFLRPDIGMEIEQLIDELHEESEVGEDFPNVPTSSTGLQKQELSMLADTDTPTNS